MGGKPNNDTNEMWERMMPPGDGIIEIPNEETTGLHPSLPAPHNPKTHKVYGISMFHQLHCLNFLRFAYYPDTIVDYPADEVEYHRDHCIDYIRQAIMCAGDASLEPLTKVGIHGMGATHLCRNYDRMFTFAYEHRSDKKHGNFDSGTGTVTHTPAHRNKLGDDDDDDETTAAAQAQAVADALEATEGGHAHAHGHGH